MKKTITTVLTAALLCCAALLFAACASSGEAVNWGDNEMIPGSSAAASSGGGGGGGGGSTAAPARRLASGAYQVTEDFERFTVGQTFANRARVEGSSFQITADPAGGGSGSISIVSDGGSKALKITHVGPITQGQSRIFYIPTSEVVRAVGTTKKVEIEFRFKIEGTSGTVSMPYVYYTSAPSNASMTIAFNSANGNLVVYNGGQQVPISNYPKDEWHTFRGTLEFASGTFDVNINGDDLVLGAAFRQQPADGGVTDFGLVRFYLANVPDGHSLSLYLDDIKITAGL